MKQINVAMIPEVLAGIVKQLEVIDGWLSLKTNQSSTAPSARMRTGSTSMNCVG